MYQFKTELFGGMWFACVQVHLFSESRPNGSWQYGIEGQGATPEEAMAESLRLTRESLAKTLAGLV